MSAENFHRLTAFDDGFTRDLNGFMAGVDEAGRGPLAGPVVAAAVLFIRRSKLFSLNDSKKISAKVREDLFMKISQDALVGIGVVDEEQIDAINIYQASRLAMKKAVLSLTRTPDLLLVDGKMKIDLPITQRAIVKGDAKSASIAAASVIAKVYRDALMMEFDHQYPGYDFKKHKGYATQGHLEKIKKLGPCIIHRRSFAPIREIKQKKSDETILF